MLVQEEGHQVHEMQNEPEVHGDCPYRPFAGTFCDMACRMAQHMVQHKVTLDSDAVAGS